MTCKEKAIAHFQTWAYRLYTESQDHTRSKYAKEFSAWLASEKYKTARILMGIQPDEEVA